MRITDELREWMAGFEVVRPRGNGKPAMFDRLYVIADHIDEDHERELLSLRNLAWNNGYDEGFASADDWLAQNEGAMAEHGWVRLPVDADGEVIRLGDEMERGKAHGRVIALMLSNYPRKWGGGPHWGIQLEGEHAPTALDSFFHHRHEPTVEDILREFAERWDDPTHYAQGELVEDYAKRLRLAEGDA